MATESDEAIQGSGLGNPTLLNKMDELRRLNISSMVPLPQLVIVGEQSAGKSSLLESLTGFPFPRHANLCTRYATEIICRRDAVESIVASIRPAANLSADNISKLEAFNVELPVHDRHSDIFQDVFHQASAAMGLRSGANPADSNPAFSENVLRIEITGPNEEHLTIINVPGIFDVPTPGITSKNLGRFPCTHDIATQQILKRAEEVDPDGRRTIVVLTGPELLTEKATKDAVVELVKGHRGDLQLDYYVIRNRGADDVTLDLTQRDNAERAFFSEAPWNQLERSRLGIDALCLRLQQLLMERTEHYFPVVREEVSAHLKEKRDSLELMGKSRINADQQRTYLAHVATRFSRLSRYALDAYYTGHPIFQNPELRLITRIREISDAFATTLFARGHNHEFQSREEKPFRLETQSTGSRNDLYEISFEIPDEINFPEIQMPLADPFFCPGPITGDISKYIREIYLHSQGQELGTINNSILSAMFKEQSRKWKDLALAHVSNAILIVHHFIDSIMGVACEDDPVRYQLWGLLAGDLPRRYRRAIEHAEFLIHVECEGKTVTCNPKFYSLLAENRTKRQQARKTEATKNASYGKQQENSLSTSGDLEGAIADEPDATNKICEEAQDVLEAYYEIARSRFVDEIYQQVVNHFLLDGEESALRVFTPERVMSMSDEQLARIAGEDPVTKRARDKLEREIASLEKATALLRI
ncbi:hypothetical protein AAE478_009647 [Parahypoxylon ruwenzoriense]